MCIRDRAGAANFGDLDGPTSAGPKKDATAPSAAPAATTTCLLYTSDAADERSSVDLGGRRIIKKKKNKATQRNSYQIQRTTEARDAW